MDGGGSKTCDGEGGSGNTLHARVTVGDPSPALA